MCTSHIQHSFVQSKINVDNAVILWRVWKRKIKSFSFCLCSHCELCNVQCHGIYLSNIVLVCRGENPRPEYLRDGIFSWWIILREIPFFHSENVNYPPILMFTFKPITSFSRCMRPIFLRKNHLRLDLLCNMSVCHVIDSCCTIG